MTVKREIWLMNLPKREEYLYEISALYKRRRKIAKFWLADSLRRGDEEVTKFYKREASLCYYVIRALKHELERGGQTKVVDYGRYVVGGVDRYQCQKCKATFADMDANYRYCPYCGKRIGTNND